MSLKGKNLGLRTVSGAVLGGVVVGAALLSKWAFAVVAAVVTVGVVWELLRMVRTKEGVEPQNLVATALGVALVVECALSGSPVALLTLLLLFPVVFIVELARGKNRPLENVAATLMAVVYGAVPMALMVCMGQRGGEWEPAWVLAVVMTVWVNDIFAYLVGCSIGKHKMCPTISPKKSWEGLFGGLIFAVAFAMGAGYMMMGNIYLWGGLGLAIALAGVVGDLLESKIKRECGVKDSGNLIPGHGGMLDRFDALFLAAPMAYIYMIIFGL
jgi:phosphatidate cytidylyltransferase